MAAAARQATTRPALDAAFGPAPWLLASHTSQIADVVGLGSEAFSTSEGPPGNRRGPAAWSYGLHLWDGNLFLSVSAPSIGEGERFTGADAEATATRLALHALAALPA